MIRAAKGQEWRCRGRLICARLEYSVAKSERQLSASIKLLIAAPQTCFRGKIMKAWMLLLLLGVLAHIQSAAAKHSRSTRGMYPLNRFLKPAHKPSIKLFIGVPTRREHRPYRDAARSTWMQQAKQAGSIVTKFFIAHDNSDPVQLSWMAAEQKQYGDMIIQGPEQFGRVKFKDGNPGVTLRMAFLLEKAVTEHNAEYVAKIDDDAYVNIPVLMHMLHRNISERPFWYGYPIPGAPIDEQEIYGMTYARYGPWVDDLIYKPLVPQYMNGALVLFSSVVAEALHAVNSIIGLRMLWDDDVAIGLWLSAFDMRYLNDTEAGVSVKAYRPIELGYKEWDQVPKDNFCLSAALPYALVHPCKDPLIIRRVHAIATQCQDPPAPRRLETA